LPALFYDGSLPEGEAFPLVVSGSQSSS
jgi:hypothetical protein